MKAKWYLGMPPAEAVAEHETDHPRTDGIRLRHISVTAHRPGGGPNDYDHFYVECDDRSYGEWIVHYPNSNMVPYASIARLKAVDGVVYEEMGFTGWHPLGEKLDTWKWAKDARFFPVGDDGLPIGFTPESDDAKY